MRNRISLLWLTILFVYLLAANPLCAETTSLPSPSTIAVDILTPSPTGYKQTNLPLVQTSGWQLTVRLRANPSLLQGLGVAPGELFYPKLGVNGTLIFNDPDGCLDFYCEESPGTPGCDTLLVGENPAYSDCSTCEGLERNFWFNCQWNCNDCNSFYGQSDVSFPGDWSAECLELYTALFIEEDGGLNYCPLADDVEVRFTPDVDMPGVSDPSGVERLRESDAECTNPHFMVFQGEGSFYGSQGGNTYDVAIGPFLGGLVEDGYGCYQDDLPGLVLLSNTGFGRVWHPGTAGPITARNLSGFFDAVGYTLVSKEGRVEIITSMTVPEALFRPLVLLDQAYGEQVSCLDDFRTRPTACVADAKPPVFYDRSLYNGLGLGQCGIEPFTEILAFVVNGFAPTEFSDLDGDGDVDIRDIKRSGYPLLSNIATLQVEWNYEEDDAFAYYYYDLDGNGWAACEEVRPAGSGRVTPPPR